jgi:hypothetical protein
MCVPDPRCSFTVWIPASLCCPLWHRLHLPWPLDVLACDTLLQRYCYVVPIKPV